jgi:hypothetical protein
MLSVARVKEQTCKLCTKVAHTGHSCPDQTQSRELDSGKEDEWVRKLIDMPAIDIALVNKGKTLREGVREWMKKGETMNKGNPWEGSTRMEDSLRKRLGYHKAMDMSRGMLGWIEYGVPLQFIKEQRPRAMAFRNYASAEEGAEFVNKEHASNVLVGSYVEVER